MGAVVIIVVAITFALLFGTFLRSEARLGRQGYDRRRKPPSRRPSHTFDPQRSVTLRGGARVGSTNATWPLVPLTVDEAWARLGGLFNVWIAREEVTNVRCLRAMLGWGVHFDTSSGDLDGVLYWTFSAPEVLGAFGRLGWPVAAAPTPGTPASLASGPTRQALTPEQRFSKRPLVAAGVVGLIGLGVLAGLWLTPIHSSHLDCGSLVGSVGTFTDHSVHGPCQHARSVRFTLGFVAAAIGAPLPWGVFFLTGGRARLGRSRR